MLLLIEYLPEHGVHVAMPMATTFCDDREFVFDTDEALKEFVDTWFNNPYAAAFAYEVREMQRA